MQVRKKKERGAQGHTNKIGGNEFVQFFLDKFEYIGGNVGWKFGKGRNRERWREVFC